MLTVSEALFELFCLQNRLAWSRVATAQHVAERRPDYLIRGRARRARRIFVELKEIRPNAEEQRHIAALGAGEVSVISTTPGKRMRALIAKSAEQLRVGARAGAPTLLVVYDATAHLQIHTDPAAVLRAMRGLDEVPVYLDPDPAIEPVFGEAYAGGGKAMTKSANTSISAIGVLGHSGPRALQLIVYHNRFAQRPIRLRELRSRFIIHLRMRHDEQDWLWADASARSRGQRQTR